MSFKEGYNKAEYCEKVLWHLNSNETKKRPCVFLSHKKEDKEACKEIAEYLSNAGIDYYLDELDTDLQQAVNDKDPILITESLKKGIRESTHMLVVISEKTYLSQWVPFEVGYGHSAILDQDIEEKERGDRIKLSILTLKEISKKSLPDFLHIGFIIRGTKSLNNYITRISGEEEKEMIAEKRIILNGKLIHPLDNILNWEL